MKLLYLKKNQAKTNQSSKLRIESQREIGSAISTAALNQSSLFIQVMMLPPWFLQAYPHIHIPSNHYSYLTHKPQRQQQQFNVPTLLFLERNTFPSQGLLTPREKINQCIYKRKPTFICCTSILRVQEQKLLEIFKQEKQNFLL